jgi:hypothetical protein
MHEESRIAAIALGSGMFMSVIHAAPALAAPESIEFVGEHLAEIAMDNRYATMPLWARPTEGREPGWQFKAQAALAQTHSGGLAIDGPMFALGATRRIAGPWRLPGFAFFDDLRLSGGTDRRPLEVTFATGVPLALPAAAEFTGLAGAARSTGAGFATQRAGNLRLWRRYEWTAGVLWHRVALSDYSCDFQVLDGPDAGATGVLDYNATYSHIVPFFGLAWPREYGNWAFTPHVQAAMPLPRRGVVGHIRGAGYDLRGDTGMHGDRPFGDPSLTMGFDVSYRPWNLAIDLGSAASQALLEPLIHEGVAHNWLISISWSY